MFGGAKGGNFTVIKKMVEILKKEKNILKGTRCLFKKSTRVTKEKMLLQSSTTMDLTKNCRLSRNLPKI